MSSPLTDQQAATLAYLDELPDAQAAAVLVLGIRTALEGHALDDVPGLIRLMCRYDPVYAAQLLEVLESGLDLTGLLERGATAGR